MTIIDYLEKAAQEAPDKTAFIDEKNTITYNELADRVRAIAASLTLQLKNINGTVTVNEPVAVIIDRNIESICAFLGIAMSRNFYVPIDDTQPTDRIQTILGQMQPKAIISLGNIPEEMKTDLHEKNGCMMLDIHSLPAGVSGDVEFPVIEYDSLITGKKDPELLDQVRLTAMDTDPLYAMCTSGSTGVPKGVLICNRSVMDFIPVFCRTFNFSENEIFGNQAPFDFDVSVKDIYSGIYLKATVYIIPKVCFSMPKLLMDQLEEKQVTTITWAVSALCIVAGMNALDYKRPSYIRNVLFSGEVMPIKMLNIWRQFYPGAMFVNLYGPTEITCNCTYYIIDREFGLTDKLPLGRTFENENVLYLNEDNKPISAGETGEICVTGTCLSPGYYRNPEKTAAAFVQNPLNDRYPETMYRTGDLVTLEANGEYYFAARKDFQIKHMGHRIELEEIEAHLNAQDKIRRASCLFDADKNKIVAFYCGDTDKVEIINNLKEKLPKYMLPNIYLQLDDLPLTKNGKIDRQGLKKMYEGIKNAKMATKMRR